MAVRYFKTREAQPLVLHVEREDSWEHYSSAGRLIDSSETPFPQQSLAAFEEISQTEYERLFHSEPDPASQTDVAPVLNPEQEQAFLRSATVFRPRVWRLAVVYSSGWTALALLTFGLLARFDPSARRLVLAMGAVGLPFMWTGYTIAARNRATHLSVRVGEGHIRGVEHSAVPMFEDSLSLTKTWPLDDLDRKRSASRGWTDRLLGRQYLYSKSGERIRVERWAMLQEDVERLFRMLGIAN